MALIPPEYLDCVVAIGVEYINGQKKWIASGFLYGRYYVKDEHDKKYAVFLVTNRHVFENLSQVVLRFNPQRVDEPAQLYYLDLFNNKKNKLWFAHPNPEIDVAVTTIDIRLLRKNGMQFKHFQSDEHVANIDKLNELGISEGDFVYVLGFPLGIIGEKRNTVIVRSGIIARIRDALTRDNQEYLIDAFIFPGNSGGPVVCKPEFIKIEGTKTIKSSYLIGIVKGYIPYQDVAISFQTKHPRVIFEENSGLTAVHPIDFVQELVEENLKWLEKIKESNKSKSDSNI